MFTNKMDHEKINKTNFCLVISNFKLCFQKLIHLRLVIELGSKISCKIMGYFQKVPPEVDRIQNPKSFYSIL